MFAVTYPRPSYRPQAYLGLLGFFFLGFYLGCLYLFGVVAAFMFALPVFKGKFRLMVSLGGGFSGLAAWVTIMLNHREQYDRVVAFLARHMTENWATFLTDACICGTGAFLLVGSFALTKKSANKAVVMLRGKPAEPQATEPAEKE